MGQGDQKYYSNEFWKILFYIFCGLLIFFLVSPILIVIPMSFNSAEFLIFPPTGYSVRWYVEFFSSPDWIGSIWMSFRIAVMVMVLATVLGTLASFAIVRGRFWGKELAYAFVVSPLIIPLITVALCSYFLLASLKLIGSQIGLVLIHTVIAVPFVVVIVSNTLKNFDVSLEKASLIMGANRLKTFFKVTFPIVGPGVFSAAFFAFLTSFDELIIILFIGGIRNVTLPRRMWQGLQMEFDPRITVAASLLVVFSISVLLLIMIIQSISDKLRG